MEEFNLDEKIEKSKDAYIRQHALEDYLGKLLKALWSERRFMVNQTEIGRALQEEGKHFSITAQQNELLFGPIKHVCWIKIERLYQFRNFEQIGLQILC